MHRKKITWVERRLQGLFGPSTVLLLVAGLLSGLVPIEARASSSLAHYLVFEIDEAETIQPVFHRFVELAEPPRRVSEARLRVLERDGQPDRPSVTLRMRSAAGDMVFRDHIHVPEWIRGEFAGEALSHGGFRIESHRFRDPRRAFVVRVPVEAGATLVIDGPPSAVFDLDAIVRSRENLRVSQAPVSPEESLPEPPPGNPANRVDLLIMGDGYTAAQSAAFSTDASNLESSFFNITPYSEYKNYVNVTSLFIASAESGADHPPYDDSCEGDDPSCCADEAAQSDPLAGTYVNTAFNARYCKRNIHRLLVVDTSLVFAAASAVPDWDEILVLVNDSTYGGSGGTIGVIPTHPSAVDIAQHEFGHSFTRLADEYDSPYPDYPTCSDISGPACRANVTDETTRSLIKWSPWILPTTPVPTPEGDPLYTDLVGLFEGAQYQTTGMYRPRDRCKMRSSSAPFGEICSQEYVLKLYQGWWGAPWTGIDPIEPGSENPPTGTINIDPNSSVTLSVDLLEPVGGPPLDVAWAVDGTPVPGESSDSFVLIPSGVGNYQVEIQVEDITALVHPSMADTSLQSSRQWTIVVSDCPSAPLTGCSTPGKSILMIKDKDADGPGPRDKLVWKWLNGPATLQSAFGDPVNTANYRLCLYTGATPTAAMQVNVPPGSPWRAIGTRGYKYIDPTMRNDGVLKTLLKGSATPGKSKILLLGKDSGIPLPSLPLDSSGEAIIQLSNNENENCWEETFTPPFSKNESDAFKAKSW